MAEDAVDIAEEIWKQKGYRLHSFDSAGTSQYVLKKGKLSVTPSFYTIRELCEWLIENTVIGGDKGSNSQQ